MHVVCCINLEVMFIIKGLLDEYSQGFTFQIRSKILNLIGFEGLPYLAEFSCIVKIKLF